MGTLMKRNFVLALCFITGWLPQVAWAGWELEGGAGMEYFTAQAYTRDHDGKYLQTLLGSTLATAKVKYSFDGCFAQLTGGIGDWESSASWTGSDGDIPVNEDYTATWQQYYKVDLGYENRLGQVGVSYWDRDLKNGYVYTEGQLYHLAYRLQACEVFARLNLYQNSSTQISLGGAYAPAAKVALYHNEYSYPDSYDIYHVDSAGQGPSWHGNLQLKYRDSANWGIDILYDAGWADFSNPSNLSELSLRFGSLTGFFILWL
jgi:hypothetical protein